MAESRDFGSCSSGIFVAPLGIIRRNAGAKANSGQKISLPAQDLGHRQKTNVGNSARYRHQAITYLTGHSRLADPELQLITGHSRRETLTSYQHVVPDGEIEAKSQAAMKKADLRVGAEDTEASSKPTVS